MQCLSYGYLHNSTYLSFGLTLDIVQALYKLYKLSIEPDSAAHDVGLTVSLSARMLCSSCLARPTVI